MRIMQTVRVIVDMVRLVQVRLIRGEKQDDGAGARLSRQEIQETIGHPKDSPLSATLYAVHPTSYLGRPKTPKPSCAHLGP